MTSENYCFSKNIVFLNHFLMLNFILGSNVNLQLLNQLLKINQQTTRTKFYLKKSSNNTISKSTQNGGVPALIWDRWEVSLIQLVFWNLFIQPVFWNVHFWRQNNPKNLMSFMQKNWVSKKSSQLSFIPIFWPD